MIEDYVPIARALIGLSKLKIITFGPRPQDFFACNAPHQGPVRDRRGDRGELRAGPAWWPTRPTGTTPASPASARRWPGRWARAATTPR